MEEKNEKKKISSIGWFFLYMVSIVVDGVQILIAVVFPPIGEIVNTVFNIIFGVIYAHYLGKRGVSMVSGSNLIRLLVTFGIDEVSLGFVPAWTICTWLTHRNARSEENPDKIKSKIFNKFIGAVDSMDKIANIMPLNQNGIRKPPVINPLNSGRTRLPPMVK